MAYTVSHLREVNADGIMMPLSVADLRQFPTPLGRLERIEVDTMAGLSPHQQHHATVVNEQRKVMTIHT